MVYNEYSKFLREKFHEKVYKIPIKVEGLSCPNRDGTCGVGGCIFCGEEGGSFENREGSIKEQVQKNIAHIEDRYNAHKFIAYIQNYTATYMEIENFKKTIEEAVMASERIVGVNISARPDFLTEGHLDYLEKLNEKYMVTLEVGLQTPNYHTLVKINRGHLLSDYIDAVQRIKRRGLRISTHLILNLPYDDDLDAIESANIISVLGVDEVKVHALYILKGTKLGQMYLNGEVELISKEEYVDRVILFLRHLDEKVVIGRLLGRAPEENTLFCNWDTSWWKIRDEIIEKMEKEGYYQGQLRKEDSK